MPEDGDVRGSKTGLLPAYDSALKNRCFVQNDCYLSIVSLIGVLLIPVFTWGMVDDRIAFAWIGGMLAIAGVRWFCGYRLQEVYQTRQCGNKDSNHSFWSGATFVLALIGGLGWAAASILFFPLESPLHLGIAALVLLGLSGIGAIAYSPRPPIAVAYIACVISPFATRLCLEGGGYEFTLASFLVIIGLVYCIAAERINQMLDIALEFDNGQEVITQLEEHSLSLYSIAENEIRRRRKLEKVDTKTTTEDDNSLDVSNDLEERRDWHSNKLAQLENDFYNLEQLDLDSNTKSQILAIRERVMSLGKIFEKESLSAQNKSETVELPRLEHHKPAVLLVDEDKDGNERILDYLNSLDLTVLTVQSIPEAFSMLCEMAARKHYFDLVIINNCSPELYGPDLAQCLGEDDEFCDLPIVLIDSDSSISEEAAEHKNIELIIKHPVEPEAMDSIINILFEHKQDSSHKKLNSWTKTSNAENNDQQDAQFSSEPKP